MRQLPHGGGIVISLAVMAPFWLAVAWLLAGCVSFGVECKTERVNAYAKVKRAGVGISKKQVESMALFKEKVCP